MSKRRSSARAAGKRKTSRGEASETSKGKARPKTKPKEESLEDAKPVNLSVDSSANPKDLPPKRTRGRKKKEPDDPSVLLAEMKDLEKRLRATVGGTECPDDEFKKMVEHLRTVCPGPKNCKVIVQRIDPEEMTAEYGSCERERSVFTISINRALNEYETEHVLIHEWAHMLAWRPYHPLMGDHGSDWGVWYAMTWRKYHGVE